MFVNQILIDSSDSSEQSSSEEHSNSPKINMFVAYRHAEVKLQKTVQLCFQKWKEHTIENYRENYLIAKCHHEERLLQKGFDGIMEYAITSGEFHKKILELFYKNLLRHAWKAIVAYQPQPLIVQSQTQNEFCMNTPKELSQIKTYHQALHQTQTQQQKLIANVLNSDVKQPQGKQKLKKLQSNIKSAEPLMLNRMMPASSAHNFQDQSQFSGFTGMGSRRRNDRTMMELRKYKPITQKIELPEMTIKTKECISQKKQADRGIQEERKRKFEMQNRQIQGREQEIMMQKNRSQVRKKREVILELLTKQKIVEENLLRELGSCSVSSQIESVLQNYQKSCKQSTKELWKLHEKILM